jgi:hypothetical protein
MNIVMRLSARRADPSRFSRLGGRDDHRMHVARGPPERVGEPKLDAESSFATADGDAIGIAHTGWPT